MSKTVVAPGEYVDAKAGRTDEQAKTLSNWKIARTKLLQVVEKNTHFTWNGVGKLPNDQRVHIVGVQGGVEGFSLLLRTFLTLAPETFKVKEDMETDDQRKKSENLIQSVQNLFVNMVVVGALLMSITGPMVMETPTAGIKTLNLFGETVVFWIELIYMFMISVSFVTSAILTYATMRFYTHLTFWLITPGSRVKYIEHSAPVAYIVLSSMFSFGTMMVAIGLGSVITDCYKAIPVTVVLLAFFYHCFWLEISNKAPGQMAAALLMRDVVDTFNDEGGENDN